MMRTTYRAVAALVLLVLPALALATVTFERRWHWDREDVGHSVALTADGGYLVGGETWVDTTLYGIVLARTDSLGDTISVTHILNVDYGYSGYVCHLAGGDFVTCGTRNTWNVFARGFSASGDSAWSYNPSTHGRVYALIGTSDGGCIIAGRIPDSSYDMGVIKLDSGGHEEWTHSYDDTRIMGSYAYGVAETRDSGFILCGDAQDYIGKYVRLVRTNALGESLWTQLYSSSVGLTLRAVRETPDYGFLAVGTVWDSLNAQNALYLLRTDSNGVIMWTRDISIPGAGTQATAMCATRDSGYMVAGYIDWGDSARAWLVKLDAGADTVWTNVLPGAGKEQAEDVWQAPDGGYAVAGTSDRAGGSVLLIKTDSLGVAPYGVAEEKPVSQERIALSVAPNPTKGIVRVEYSLPVNTPISLRVYDVAGHQVYSAFGLPTSDFHLDLRSMPTGVYLLRFEHDGRTATRKLVIE